MSDLLGLFDTDLEEKNEIVAVLSQTMNEMGNTCSISNSSYEEKLLFDNSYPLGLLLEKLLRDKGLQSRKWMKLICVKFANLVVSKYLKTAIIDHLSYLSTFPTEFSSFYFKPSLLERQNNFNLPFKRIVSLLQDFSMQEDWKPYDIYNLLKASVFCFNSDSSNFTEMLVKLRNNIITPVSLMSDEKTTLAHVLVDGSKHKWQLLTSDISKTNKCKTLDQVIDEMSRSKDWHNSVYHKDILQRVKTIVSEAYNLIFDASNEICVNKFDDLKKELLSKEVNESIGDVMLIKFLMLVTIAIYKVKSENTEKFIPSVTQFVSYCILMIMSFSKRGHLLQVGAGEGKSCIIAMVAATYAMMGRYVDVITSSSVLAKRDSDDWKVFYGLLGISCDCNNEILGYKLSENRFEVKVLYGTVDSFARDILYFKFSAKLSANSCKQRDINRSVALIDEADALLIDQSFQCTYISEDDARNGMRHLEPLLALVWWHVSRAKEVRSMTESSTPNTKFFFSSSEVFFKVLFDIVCEIKKDLSINEPLDLLKNAEDDIFKQLSESYFSASFDQCDKMLKNISQQKILEFIKFVENLCCGPRIRVYKLGRNGCLEPIITLSSDSFTKSDNLDSSDKDVFILLQSNGFISRLYNSKTYVTKIEDLIKRSIGEGNGGQINIPKFLQNYTRCCVPLWIKNAFKAKDMTKGKEYTIRKNKYISPVDFTSSGVIETNKKFSDGLQQFLEIKHLLPVTRLQCISNFMANVSLFKRYNQLLGVSGSLGSHDDQKLLSKEYSVEFFSIPDFKQKMFHKLEELLLDDEEEWIDEINRRVKEELKTTSPVSKNRRAVLIICEDINTALKLKDKVYEKTKLYCDDDEQMNHINVQEKIQPGEVIITTNLGARGTDFDISEDVASAGGLFVIVTFSPYNERALQQAFGRTARRGKPGSAQIIAKRELSMQIQEHGFKRDLRHSSKSLLNESMRNTEFQKICAKENLFNTYCKFKHNIQCKESNSYVNNSLRMQLLNDCWAKWLNTIKDERLLENDEQKLNKAMGKALEMAHMSIEEGRIEEDYFYYTLKLASSIIFPHMSNREPTTDDYESAIKLFKACIDAHKDWSAFAYYYQAYCILRLQKNRYLQKALAKLGKAKRYLEGYKKELLLTKMIVVLNSLIPMDREAWLVTLSFDYKPSHISAFCRYIKNTLLIYSSLEKNIENIVDDLNLRLQNVNIKSELQILFYDISILNSYQDANLQQPIDELNQMGLSHIFTMTKKIQIEYEDKDNYLCFIFCVAYNLHVAYGYFRNLCAENIIKHISDYFRKAIHKNDMQIIKKALMVITNTSDFEIFVEDSTTSILNNSISSWLFEYYKIQPHEIALSDEENLMHFIRTNVLSAIDKQNLTKYKKEIRSKSNFSQNIDMIRFKYLERSIMFEFTNLKYENFINCLRKNGYNYSKCINELMGTDILDWSLIKDEWFCFFVQAAFEQSKRQIDFNISLSKEEKEIVAILVNNWYKVYLSPNLEELENTYKSPQAAVDNVTKFFGHVKTKIDDLMENMLYSRYYKCLKHNNNYSGLCASIENYEKEFSSTVHTSKIGLIKDYLNYLFNDSKNYAISECQLWAEIYNLSLTIVNKNGDIIWRATPTISLADRGIVQERLTDQVDQNTIFYFICCNDGHVVEKKFGRIVNNFGDLFAKNTKKFREILPDSISNFIKRRVKDKKLKYFKSIYKHVFSLFLQSRPNLDKFSEYFIPKPASGRLASDFSSSDDGSNSDMSHYEDKSCPLPPVITPAVGLVCVQEHASEINVKINTKEIEANKTLEVFHIIYIIKLKLLWYNETHV